MIIKSFAVVAGLAASFAVPAFAQPGPAAMFDRFDSDGDGAVTYSEVQAWRTRFFTRADADANGFVTAEEIQAMRAQAAGDGVQGRGSRRGGRGGDPIARHDADGDGQLSQAEFVDAPFPALERFDRNNDGRLTRDELPGRGGG
jgi:hypothetical protein